MFCRELRTSHGHALLLKEAQFRALTFRAGALREDVRWVFCGELRTSNNSLRLKEAQSTTFPSVLVTLRAGVRTWGVLHRAADFQQLAPPVRSPVPSINLQCWLRSGKTYVHGVFCRESLGLPTPRSVCKEPSSTLSLQCWLRAVAEKGQLAALLGHDRRRTVLWGHPRGSRLCSVTT